MFLFDAGHRFPPVRGQQHMSSFEDEMQLPGWMMARSVVLELNMAGHVCTSELS